LDDGWERSAQQIAGKIVLITGSTRGSGGRRRSSSRATAPASRSTAETRQSRGRRRGHSQGGGCARAYGADLSIAGEATRLVSAVTADFGALDVLINNGAVLPQHKDPPWKRAASEFALVMATNLVGPFEASMAAISWMEEHGRPGRIVNISSSVADLSNPKLGLAAYAISKIALEGFSRYLAFESEELGVVVTTLRAPTADNRNDPHARRSRDAPAVATSGRGRSAVPVDGDGAGQ
jgi:NAD(P)-dependent dehydrogenase (short-subunit alcohol dehydrogenase family)